MTKTAERPPAVRRVSARKRLTPEDRREEILHASITYFSTYGFMGSTRDLAREIGVTQPLLYRYFASKSELIDAVFEEMFARQRKFHWEKKLSDRTSSVSVRMIDFFSRYAEHTYSYEWIRIYTFAGLLDGKLNQQYIQKVTDPILRKICVELGVENGLPDRKPDEVTQEELDILWILHGGLFYFAIRKFVYGDNTERSLDFPISEGVLQAIGRIELLHDSMKS